MEILKKLSIKPSNEKIYELALIHESYSNENDMDDCYERLEFLGNAVLDLIVSEYLYNENPDLTEGQLTRLRSNYVCKKALYNYSMELGLYEHIKLGAGAELSRRELDSVISDVFESFTGALYLDLGLERAKEFIAEIVIPQIENEDIFFYDYKSELKQISDQECFDIYYDLIKEEGEPHNKKFTMEVIIDGEKQGTGCGGSKKEAEQNAAKKALESLHNN